VTKEDNVSACCNLVIWDGIATGFVVWAEMLEKFPSMQPIQYIITSIIAGFVMIMLLNVKIIGTILSIICSGIWSYLGYLLIGQFTDLKKISLPWTILILVVLFILALGLHGMSKEDLGKTSDGRETFHFDRTKKKGFGKRKEFPEDVYYENAMEEIQLILDDFTVEGNTYIELHDEIINKGLKPDFIYEFDKEINAMHITMDSYIEQVNAASTEETLQYLRNSMINLKSRIIQMNNQMSQYIKSMNQTSNNNINQVVYFADCTDLESLNKRYKALCQVYHPDTGNGSSDIFTKMSDEYRLLKEKYEHHV
jgi:hypothetical protein